MIVMDSFVSSKAIARIQGILENEESLEEMVERNYQVAERYFSYEVLEEKLLHLIRTFG